MEVDIYHYKSQDEWIPFSLEREYAPQWTAFCRNITLNNPDDPHPYYDDYLRFFKSLKRSEAIIAEQSGAF